MQNCAANFRNGTSAEAYLGSRAGVEDPRCGRVTEPKTSGLERGHVFRKASGFIGFMLNSWDCVPNHGF